MKVMAILISICLITASLLWFPGRAEMQCVNNLSIFDHHINCSAHVSMAESEGFVSNGVWNQNYILNMTPEKYRHCPNTGTNYVLTFTVGEHPSCPIHGHLIEKYGIIPHGPSLHHPRISQNVKEIGTAVCIVISILTALVMIITYIVRRLIKKKAQQGHEGYFLNPAGSKKP